MPSKAPKPTKASTGSSNKNKKSWPKASAPLAPGEAHKQQLLAGKTGKKAKRAAAQLAQDDNDDAFETEMTDAEFFASMNAAGADGDATTMMPIEPTVTKGKKKIDPKNVGGTKWKQIEVDPRALGNQFGFISMEVIDAKDFKEEVQKKQKKKPKKKRKATDGDDDGVSDDAGADVDDAAVDGGVVDGNDVDDGESAHDDKTKKKKKKRKRKAKATPATDDAVDTDAADDDDGGNNSGVDSDGEANVGAGGVADDSDAENTAFESKKKKKRPSRAAAATTPAAATTDMTTTKRTYDVIDCETFEVWGGLPLHTTITQALKEQGFTKALPIQQATLPAALRDRLDVFGAAETGSGKTLAFGLPMLQRISELGALPTRTGMLGLVLEPTRELAMQVKDALTKAAVHTGIRIASMVGGLSMQKQNRILSQKPHIIVATPGRLWELMDTTAHEYLLELRELMFLVIDEADRMLVEGHFKELNNIIDRLPPPVAKKGDKALRKAEAAEAAAALAAAKKRRKAKMTKAAKAHQFDMVAPVTDDRDAAMFAKLEDSDLEEEGNIIGKFKDVAPAGVGGKSYRRQTFVFSATLVNIDRSTFKKGSSKASWEEKSDKANAEHSIQRLMWKLHLPAPPKVLDFTPKDLMAKTITQRRIDCMIDEKDLQLYNFLCLRPGRCLVFVNHITAVRRLAQLLTLLRIRCKPLHSQMQQRARLKALDTFRSDKHAVLVATDVAARGLDIPNVQFVVHYHCPRESAVYVHRSGRTARAGTEGLSLMLVAPEEYGHFKRILHATKQPEMPPLEEVHKFMRACKDRVKLAQKVLKYQAGDEKEKYEKAWRRRNLEDMDIHIDSDDDQFDSDDNVKLNKNIKNERQKQEVKQAERDLKRMLDSKLLAHGVSSNYITHAQMGLPEMLKANTNRRLMDDREEKKEREEGASSKSRGAKRFRRR